MSEPVPPKSPPFSEFYTEAHHAALRDPGSVADGSPGAYERAQDALFRWLDALRVAGDPRLRPFAAGGHLNQPEIRAWDDWLAGRLRPDRNLRHVLLRPGAPDGEGFVRKSQIGRFAMRVLMASHRHGHAETCTAIERGDFPWHGFDVPCQTTGLYLTAEVAGWRPTAFWNGVPATPEAVPLPRPVRHAAIEFPTGRLIAADWIRIAGFNQGVDRAIQEDQPPEDDGDRARRLAHEGRSDDVGSGEGRANHTANHLRAGLVHVFASNTSAHVVVAPDGSLSVAQVRWGDEGDTGDWNADGDEDPPGIADTPSICTDLWWTTLIEEDRAAELIAEGRAAAGAEVDESAIREELDAHASKWPRHRVAVEPGVYHLYWSGCPDAFDANLPGGAIDLGYDRRTAKTHFVLSRHPLGLGCDTAAAPIPMGRRGTTRTPAPAALAGADSEPNGGMSP